LTFGYLAPDYIGNIGTDKEMKMNASYIISVARKLGCSIFLLPEDIIEVTKDTFLYIFSLYSDRSVVCLLGMFQ
jgi:hypothetical protein